MNADVISSLAKVTLDGSMPFPQIVGKLIAEGVEYYHVDYAANSFTFYSAVGSIVTASLPFEGLPSVSSAFDATALRAAILDSQQHGQNLDNSANALSARVFRDTLRFSAASGSLTWVVRGISTLSGSLEQNQVVPDNSFKPNPLRGRRVSRDG